jgi:hypothetical protein
MAFPFFKSLKSWFTDPEKDGWVIRRILTDYGYGQTKSYVLALALGAVAAACTAGTAFIVGTVVNQAYVDRNLQSIAAWLSSSSSSLSSRASPCTDRMSCWRASAFKLSQKCKGDCSTN